MMCNFIKYGTHTSKNNRLQTQTKVSYSINGLFSTTNCIPAIILSKTTFCQLKLFKLNELKYKNNFSNIKTTFRGLRDVTPTAVSNGLKICFQ